MQSQKTTFNLFRNDPNQNYNLMTYKFLDIVNKHASLKKKFVRGNNAPLMNREFQKEIYVRSRLRNKDKISEKGIKTHKSFWNLWSFHDK